MKNERKVSSRQENEQILVNPDLKSFVDFSIGLFIGLEAQSLEAQNGRKISIDLANLPKQNNDKSTDYLETFKVIYNNPSFYGFSSHYYNWINGVKIEDMLSKEIGELKMIQKAEKEKRIRTENENNLKNVATQLLGPIIMMQDFARKPQIFGNINPYSKPEDLSIDDANMIIKTSIKAGYERNVRDVIGSINNKTVQKTVDSWIKELSPAKSC